MTLGELIAYLKSQPQDLVLDIGLGHPHSYRGYYECLAFEPVNTVGVWSMLDEAVSCVGRTFTGYKGGHFTMALDTNCYLALVGEASQYEITNDMLDMWFGGAKQ